MCVFGAARIVDMTHISLRWIFQRKTRGVWKVQISRTHQMIEVYESGDIFRKRRSSIVHVVASIQPANSSGSRPNRLSTLLLRKYSQPVEKQSKSKVNFNWSIKLKKFIWKILWLFQLLTAEGNWRYTICGKLGNVGKLTCSRPKRKHYLLF